MTVPYPDQPPGQQPPPGYGWGSQPPPPPPPYYPAPQQKSRRGLWIALGAVALIAVVVIAVTVVLFLTRDPKPEAKPDITELKAAMLIKESDFGTVSDGEFNADGPDQDPEWEKIDVDPAECEYMVQYPKASQQVRGELSNPDGEGFIVTLRINDEWPDLKAILAECDSKVLKWDDLEGTVHKADVPDLPDWAVGVDIEADDLEGGGFTYLTGYYRGIQIDVEHFGGKTSKSERADLIRMFNAQVERLSQR